jgi:acylphosphatase
MNKRLHLIIKGRVQGVFYRDNTKKRANELDLGGFVRNLSDGTVEVVAEGPEESLKELVKWCWQGSKYAKVEDIQIKWQEFKNKFLSFEIRY